VADDRNSRASSVRNKSHYEYFYSASGRLTLRCSVKSYAKPDDAVRAVEEVVMLKFSHVSTASAHKYPLAYNMQFDGSCRVDVVRRKREHLLEDNNNTMRRGRLPERIAVIVHTRQL